MSALSAVSISKMACVRAQLSLTLCDPMDPMCQPDSSVRGILQARILEWVAISSSRASPRTRGGTRVSCIGRWVLYC